MKFALQKHLIIFLILNVGILGHRTASAQSNFLNYQAVARDSTGQILSNRTLGVTLELTDLSGSVIHYSESHPATTNAQGLFNLTIGAGSVITGNYAAIPWSAGRVFIRTYIDAVGGSNYRLIGRSEMLAVP